MEHKKNLAKIALAALILASASPVNGQADENPEAAGTFLAAGCPAHGCNNTSPPSKNIIADTATDSGDAYHTRSNTYQAGSNSNQPSGARGPSVTGATPNGSTGRYNNNRDNTRRDAGTSGNYDSSTGGYGGSAGGYSDSNRSYGSQSYSTSRYDSQRSAPSGSLYLEERSSGFDNRSRPSVEYGETRNYNVTTDYDYNYAGGTTVTSSATLTEAQLLGMLSPQERAIYLSLDPEGKALAIQLASQDSYQDKDLAVKEAQRRMNDRRGLRNR